MRFTGGVLVLAVMTALGIELSARLKKRKVLLEKTLLFIHSMKIDFEYNFLPLENMIEKYAEDATYASLRFLSQCHKKLSCGVDFPLAWSQSVESAAGYTAEERDKLLSLGKYLGTSSSDSQVNILEVYRTYFEQLSTAASEKADKYSETVLFSFVFLGIGIFVIII